MAYTVCTLGELKRAVDNLTQTFGEETLFGVVYAHCGDLLVQADLHVIYINEKDCLVGEADERYQVKPKDRVAISIS